MLAWITDRVYSFLYPTRMLHHSVTHPHPQQKDDDSFVMVNQDDSTTQPTTPTKVVETPQRDSPVPKPLFSSPKDMMDAIPGSFPGDLMDEAYNIVSPMDKPLEAKINDAMFAWSWADTADTHAKTTALDEAWPVMAPSSTSKDPYQGTPMDIDPESEGHHSPMSWIDVFDSHATTAALDKVVSSASTSKEHDQGSPADIDSKLDENYPPMTTTFSMMRALKGIDDRSLDAPNATNTKIDSILEDHGETMDISTEPSQNTSPNVNFAAPVNSPTDSALGAPMTVINSRTMQMSTFQLTQNDSYHTTPSGTGPPSYQTSPYLLPEFSQEVTQIIQPPSLLDDILEESTTLTESASTMTLTQAKFSAKEEEKERMTELPPNPRPWGNEQTTFLCLPQKLRQFIMSDTVTTKDFQVQRLRVTLVNEDYKPKLKSKWNSSWGSGWMSSDDDEDNSKPILADYYEAFVFDEKVRAWGKTLEQVDENLIDDMEGVMKKWKKLGLVARKERIKDMEWRGMKGSGWSGKF